MVQDKEFHDENLKFILENPGMDTSVFMRGIPISALKGKWSSMLLILQNFITCEGIFGSMYVYHIRPLMIFLENRTLNLLFFLLNSLRRMATTIHKKMEAIETNIYHHGLVKKLVEYHLKSVGDTWENFSIGNFFQDALEFPKGSSVKRSRRRKTSLTIQNTPETSTQKKQ